MFKKVSILLGVVFLLIGILGFIPAATSTDSNGMTLLLGMFMVDGVHNVVHLASGVLALLAASSERYSRWYLQIFGIVYGLVAIIGLVQGTTVLGAFGVNVADNLLHIVLALIMLGVGFGIKPTTPATQTPVKPAM